LQIGKELPLKPYTQKWWGCTFVALCTFVVTLKAQPASAELAYAVTETNKLVRFDTSQPGQDAVIGTITGTGGEQILSIDFRPLTGQLYGVSANRLYTINPVTAHAQPGASTFVPALAGNVDMDFDPVSGLIRVVTDNNQNLRIDPETGAVTATDTSITGVTGLTALAFTNNFASPDRATLFAITPATNQLARIGAFNTPDGGVSQAGGVATAIGGGLTVDIDAPAGFDIAANDNDAFAVLTPAADTQSGLYKLNLSNGVASFIRLVPVGEKLRGLALLSRAVKLYALEMPSASAPGGSIVSVLSAAPGTILAQPGAPVRILGLNASEEVIDIDTRPATGDLIGLTNTNRLLKIDPLTGQTAFLSLVSLQVEGSVRAMDFHPFTDQLRIIGENGQNMTVVPDTGVANEEPDLDVTAIIAGAFDAAGAFYAITNNQVVRFANVANGVSTPVSAQASIFGPSTALDISPVDGTAFIAQDVNASSLVGLYALSLPDGELSGRIDNLPATPGTGYRGLAVAMPGRVRFTAATASVIENAGVATIALQRDAGSSGPISVQLGAAAGTATSPDDFGALVAKIDFADGEVTKVFNLPIFNDVLDENEETIALTLSQPALGATIGTPAAATLTIIDNDPQTGAPPTVLILSPTADMAHTASSVFITLAGTATDSDGTVTSVAWTNDRGFVGTASSGAAAASVEWYATDVQLAPGVNTITVTATDDAGNQAVDTIVVTVNDLSYFLAEGATGTFFDLDLLLANPNQTPVNITATFLKPLGQGTVVQHYTLPKTSRMTIDVEAITGLENAEVSTIVTAPAATPIVVERTMRWNETGYGAHTDKASPSTSNRWYFAEGSQGFFFTYLLLANPHNAPNEVFVTYLREGDSGVTRSYQLAPLQRYTVDIGADEDLVNRSFGMEVVFTLPGIAERAMYFGFNPLWVGGHESVGVTLPSRNWFLAEGATGAFFETFVLFANPSATTANVSVRYLPATGSPVGKLYEVPAGQRKTVNIEGEDPMLASAAVATEVTSDVPIIVERAQYWPDPVPTWYETHNSFGVTATGRRWGLAEGRVGLGAGYQTYILLANPNDNQVSVDITFLREDGTTLLKNFIVEPTSRVNVAVGGPDVPEITDGQFGAVITASHPIAVERAMYSDQAGATWQAGTNATATRLP
jgi:Domain of unknown function (DUF4394)/Calx-beta domain